MFFFLWNLSASWPTLVCPRSKVSVWEELLQRKTSSCENTSYTVVGWKFSLYPSTMNLCRRKSSKQHTKLLAHLNLMRGVQSPLSKILLVLTSLPLTTCLESFTWQISKFFGSLSSRGRASSSCVQSNTLCTFQNKVSDLIFRYEKSRFFLFLFSFNYVYYRVWLWVKLRGTRHSNIS